MEASETETNLREGMETKRKAMALWEKALQLAENIPKASDAREYEKERKRLFKVRLEVEETLVSNRKIRESMLNDIADVDRRLAEVGSGA